MIRGIAVGVSKMLRDQQEFATLRSEVVPHLHTFAHARIWVAGCAGGEEVYSLAILLREEGLLERCRLYATDLDPAALDRARQGIFPLKTMQQHTRNYQKAGGKAAFSDYYSARYERAVMDSSLVRNASFAAHNLATDADFSEFQQISSRNVMI